MRLIASNHWFVDGNKRTALNTAELFYMVNGYELDYGEDIRSMLKLFSVRESLIDGEEGPLYLADNTTTLDPDDLSLWEGITLVALSLIEQWDPDSTAMELGDDDWRPNTIRDSNDPSVDGIVNSGDDEDGDRNGD
jgi:death-on-curing protein